MEHSVRFPLAETLSVHFDAESGIKHEKLYPPGQSPFERLLSHFPFVDGLLAQLTTVELLRLTNVSQTVRAQTYTHTPSFRVFNFVRFCQKGNHRALPNLWPHNATNKLRNWEYDNRAKKYPYIDLNEWVCDCESCHFYGHLEHCTNNPCAGKACIREEYYYSALNSTRLLSTFRRLPDSIPLTILILDGTDVDLVFVKECFRTPWGGAWLKELSLRRCAKIEHFDILEWLGPTFYKNVVNGLRVLKLWGCGTLSPKGPFKPLLATGNSSRNQAYVSTANSGQNNLPTSRADVPTTIDTGASLPSLERANYATLSLISLCRRKKINLDIGICMMEQQCVRLLAIERANVAHDILDAIGGVMGIAPHERDDLTGLVVLAEKRPVRRECCVTECNVVILKALCESCEENMTCQRCRNFYCPDHASTEYLDLLCPICGPCCKKCFPTRSTKCSECDQHFCNEHYPNGRCLIDLDTVTGNLVVRDESEFIAQEKMIEDAYGQGIESQDLLADRGRKRYETCKDCGVITCAECIDEDGWEYSVCNTAGKGCGGIICEACTNYCELCSKAGCDFCMTEPTDNDDFDTCRGCVMPEVLAQEEARRTRGDCDIPGLVDTDEDNLSDLDKTVDSNKEDSEDHDIVPELVDPDQDSYEE